MASIAIFFVKTEKNNIMTKIGITGGNSFLGRHLVSALRRADNEVLLFEGDIRNSTEVSAFVKACNTIYHLAGCNRGADKDVYEINMIGGANVVATVAAIGNRHIIFPSSNYLLRAPNNPYSICKKAVEIMLQQLSGYNSCRSSVFRISNTYGPLALPFYVSVVATFCWYEANGLGDQMPIAGDGSQTIELVPVDVVIDRLLDATRERTPFSFSEVSGRKFSIIELSETIRDPGRRKAFPALVETVKFFSKPLNLKVLPGISIDPVGDDTLVAKLIHGRIVLTKESEDSTLQSGYQRHVYQSVTDNCWIYLANGTAAMDIFSPDEEYVNTVLIDGARIKCVEVNSDIKYRIRNLSPDSVIVKYYRETDRELK